MVSPQEIELLASVLQRAPVSQIEALFLNSVLERLQVLVSGIGEDVPELDKDEEV